jgi:hypothetical protein
MFLFEKLAQYLRMVFFLTHLLDCVVGDGPLNDGWIHVLPQEVHCLCKFRNRVPAQILKPENQKISVPGDRRIEPTVYMIVPGSEMRKPSL